MGSERAGSRAYSQLVGDIVSWQLPPGTPIGEVEQAHRLGLSRTPIREAIVRLTADGLIHPVGARGAIVADLTHRDVTDLFALRLAIETRLAAYAAATGTDLTGLIDELDGTTDLRTERGRGGYYAVVTQLDTAIATAAQSPSLTRALDSARLHVRRLRRVSQDDPERLILSVGEHRTIATAITAGDAEWARAAMTVHLKASLTHILATYSGSPAQEET